MAEMLALTNCGNHRCWPSCALSTCPTMAMGLFRLAFLGLHPVVSEKGEQNDG